MTVPQQASGSLLAANCERLLQKCSPDGSAGRLSSSTSTEVLPPSGVSTMRLIRFGVALLVVCLFWAERLSAQPVGPTKPPTPNPAPPALSGDEVMLKGANLPTGG